jgi:hypothetical protein
MTTMFFTRAKVPVDEVQCKWVQCLRCMWPSDCQPTTETVRRKRSQEGVNAANKKNTGAQCRHRVALSWREVGAGLLPECPLDCVGPCSPYFYHQPRHPDERYEAHRRGCRGVRGRWAGCNIQFRKLHAAPASKVFNGPFSFENNGYRRCSMLGMKTNITIIVVTLMLPVAVEIVEAQPQFAPYRDAPPGLTNTTPGLTNRTPGFTNRVPTFTNNWPYGNPTRPGLTNRNPAPNQPPGQVPPNNVPPSQIPPGQPVPNDPQFPKEVPPKQTLPANPSQPTAPVRPSTPAR